MSDLLPCPFCGESEIVNLTEEGLIGMVGCTNCGAQNNFWEWNTRAILHCTHKTMDNITSCSEYEHWICRDCLAIEKRDKDSEHATNK